MIIWGTVPIYIVLHLERINRFMIIEPDNYYNTVNTTKLFC
jgi:hypothetical protein